MAAPKTAKTSLLDDLARTPGDEMTRMVYADALDVVGDAARATFVRSGEGGRELVAASELAWRQTVSAAPIRYCAREGSDCPKQWSALALTDDAGTRQCGTCARDVAYCATLEAVDAATRRRLLLVFDPQLRPADADARYQYARRQLGLHTARVSELPLIAGPNVPANVPALEVALGTQFPPDRHRPFRSHRVIPYPSDLIHHVNLHVHQPGPEGGRPFLVHCYRVMFASDRVAAEARLRERFGEPVRVGDAADVRTYGPFTIREEPVEGHWSVAWLSSGVQPPSRPSELPLFVGPIVPTRVGDFELAVHGRLPEASLGHLRHRSVNLRSQLLSFTLTARVPQVRPADLRLLALGTYTLDTTTDREACEARLRERFGPPVEVFHGTERWRNYGPFFIAERGGDALHLEWFADRPTWGFSVAAAARAAFVAALVDAIARATTLDEIWQLKPSKGVGCTVGWSETGDVIVGFLPGIPAVDLASAFGWSEIVAGPSEPGGHPLYVVNGEGVLAPRQGRWEVRPRLDAAPRGERFRSLAILRHPSPDDLVRIVVIRA